MPPASRWCAQPPGSEGGVPLKNVDIRQIELLCELIDTQTLGAAADRVGITSSAASQSLGRLRTAFETDLYVRQGGRYLLTPHGQQVMGGLRAIVRRWSETVQLAQGFDPGACELRFAIACVAHAAAPDLVRLHAGCRELAPHVQLDIQVPLHNGVDVQALRAGKLDILCASAPPAPDARDLHHELLCTHALTHVVVRKNHPRVGRSITLEGYLAEEHLIAHYRNLDPATRSPLDTALIGMGLPMRRSTYVQSLWSCLNMATRTDYLLTMSAEGARVLADQMPRLRILPLPAELPPVRTTLHMIWHERTHRSRAHQWLRERLRQVARDDAAAIGADDRASPVGEPA
jgi:DNA-binding transcriptional LysR family regulator